ncbi:ABC transporter ATP-binding protein [Candidatus Acetothermia bacterium]|jgi:putative ABC transport system ATP-binding protein|nr:ABC transporter ATP-binding protein [Candidatus Acetothermia bacterium]MCI2425926.1 ABC transporter ATP-binding protein [Candidatus Acetothermia bacterium]MCI2427668.1 ABC transporter ATP-binding protein [Candidatus Acetothermia bacterium]MCI2429002.1 ABC transporter ATP-binding protein [Candidatus Acetothermia bacterium]
MSLVKLRNITKEYQLGKTVVHALRGVDLAIDAGEIVAIMGPSGSGKSTLMHIIGCLDMPSVGEVEIENMPTDSLRERQLATIRGRKIGFVFQTFNLVASLTAQGNVALPMIFQKIKRTQRTQRAAELLEKIGLGDRKNHHPNELSGGERQRVSIARAMANDPDIILADEPTGNLDSESGATVMRTLRRLSDEEGKTVIVVTHNPEVAAYADRVITLRDGKIIKEERRD